MLPSFVEQPRLGDLKVALTVAGEGEEFSTRDDIPDGDGVGRGGGQDLRLRNPFFNIADPYSANCPATCPYSFHKKF